jgi:hypothetical protein
MFDELAHFYNLNYMLHYLQLALIRYFCLFLLEIIFFSRVIFFLFCIIVIIANFFNHFIKIKSDYQTWLK